MVELGEGLKIPWPLRLCGFKSRFEYEIKIAIIWMTNGCDFFCVVAFPFVSFNDVLYPISY